MSNGQCQTGRLARLPPLRMTPGMHTSDNDYLIIDDAVENTVWKSTKERSTRLPVENGKSVRIRLYKL
jgi:hypothetical protein